MDPQEERYIEIMNRRRQRKTERYYLDLQENERAVLQAAARIYAARVAAGAVGAEGDDTVIARCVHEAVKMAYCIERSVEDAQEKRPSVE